MSLNPLLTPFALADYDGVTPAQVDEAITTVLAQNRQAFTALLADQAASPTWAGLVKPLEDLHQRLSGVTAHFAQLTAVGCLPDLAAAHQKHIEAITRHTAELNQSAELHRLLEQIATSAQAESLDATARSALALLQLDGRLAGAGLGQQDQHRLQVINDELALQMQQFELNVFDAQDAWRLPVTDVEQLAGLPEGDLRRMARVAQGLGIDGWVLTLDFPTFIAVLTHAQSRSLRETLYRAYTTQASDRGDHAHQFDNGPVIKQILELRRQKAVLLGFDSYAALSQTQRSFGTAQAVVQFLDDLQAEIRPLALAELHLLEVFARQDGVFTLQPWDLEFYTERYRRQHFDTSQQAMSEYFPLERVLLGIAQLVDALFGVTMKEAAASTWDPSVTVLRFSESGHTLGYLYLDVYARPGKRPHVWMEVVHDRHSFGDGRLQLPVGVIGCNWQIPAAGEPLLLRLEDVSLLLHEFGHALHHLLTEVDHGSVAGLRGIVEDATEFPGVIFEKWSAASQSLQLLSGHYLTGALLPQPMQSKAARSKGFQGARALLDQLIFSRLDMNLHMATEAELDVQAAVDQAFEPSVPGPGEQARMAATFSHLFSTQRYAGGYYTYVWSAVLAADAYQPFEQEGVLDGTVGSHWRSSVLAKGGTRPMQALLIAFMGRSPTRAALLNSLRPSGAS